MRLDLMYPIAIQNPMNLGRIQMQAVNETVIDYLKRLRGTDGNEACNDFWDKCGAEVIAHWEAGRALGSTFNALHASYTPEGEEGPETQRLSDEMHLAFTVYAAKQNALNAKAKAWKNGE